MNLIQYSQVFYVKSINRINGTSSNFIIKLDNIDYTKEYTYIYALNMCIPKTYYLINENNNSFILQEGEAQVTIIIPPGNYSKTSFRVTLQNLLNNSSPNNFTYLITEDNILTSPDTGKYHYSVAGNGIIQPAIIITSELHHQLGFFPNTTNNFISNKLDSSHIVNFNLQNTLHLHFDICRNNTRNNVLQEIFTIGYPTSSYMQFVCADIEAYSKIYVPKQNIFQFYLTDSNNNPIDLNGIEIDITILIYKKNNISELIENYINIRKTQQYIAMKNNL